MTILSKITPRTVFLLDAWGALSSFLMSGFILPIFSAHLGIEPWLLRSLATVALSFLIYDLVIYFTVKAIRPWMIKVILFLNLGYCLKSFILIFFLPTLSLLGLSVLLVEICVVLLVVSFEYRIYQRMRREMQR